MKYFPIFFDLDDDCFFIESRDIDTEYQVRLYIGSRFEDYTIDADFEIQIPNYYNFHHISGESFKHFCNTSNNYKRLSKQKKEKIPTVFLRLKGV
jgi:hypothetical protein